MPPNNIRRRNTLTTPRAHGPGAHRMALRRTQELLRIAARRKQAWKLWVDQGLTFAAIGERLGVSNRTAHEDVMTVVRQVQASPLSEAEAMRWRQQGILDKLVATHLPKRASNASAKTVLDALAREARLHGIDKTLPTGYSVEQVLALTRSYLEIVLAVVADEGLKRRIVEAIQRKVGPGLAQAIDVTPKKPEEPEGGAAPASDTPA